MGERLLCKQEVIGSIPFTSTSLITYSMLFEIVKITITQRILIKKKIYFCTYDNSSDESAFSGCLGIKRR